jgi:hypothetical protein
VIIGKRGGLSVAAISPERESRTIFCTVESVQLAQKPQKVSVRLFPLEELEPRWPGAFSLTLADTGGAGRDQRVVLDAAFSRRGPAEPFQLLGRVSLMWR